MTRSEYITGPYTVVISFDDGTRPTETIAIRKTRKAARRAAKWHPAMMDGGTAHIFGENVMGKSREVRL